MKFAFQRGHRDRSVNALAQVATWRFISGREELQPDEIPVGSVEWIEDILRCSITPDYFPEFLHPFLSRKWRISDDWPSGEACFIKPAHRHKAWDAFIHDGQDVASDRDAPYLISEIVRFRNEYRYYVSNGKVLSGWWYWGDSESKIQWHEGEDPPDAPPLPSIPWPDDFCGAVDIGELWDGGELELIEVNAPYACGWYGEQSEAIDYARFLAAGWKSIFAQNTLSL